MKRKEIIKALEKVLDDNNRFAIELWDNKRDHNSFDDGMFAGRIDVTEYALALLKGTE